MQEHDATNPGTSGGDAGGLEPDCEPVPGQGGIKCRSSDISIDRQEVVFGPPIQGRDKSDVQIVQVRSAGPDALTVTRVALKGDLEPCDLTVLGKSIYDDLGELEETCSFLIIERDQVPRSLENGEFVEVKLVYHRNPDLGPPADAPPTGTLVIESDASRAEDRVKEVSLSVGSDTPRIQATPTVISFPTDATPGRALEESLIVRNAGTGRLRGSAEIVRRLRSPLNPDLRRRGAPN
ncbi:hypothetical protein L6V77_35450, partial [Myxococcota bacterium]|nr:hypothetical protein [Myxococcota bacterium]